MFFISFYLFTFCNKPTNQHNKLIFIQAVPTARQLNSNHFPLCGTSGLYIFKDSIWGLKAWWFSSYLSGSNCSGSRWPRKAQPSWKVTSDTERWNQRWLCCSLFRSCPWKAALLQGWQFEWDKSANFIVSPNLQSHRRCPWAKDSGAGDLRTCSLEASQERKEGSWVGTHSNVNGMSVWVGRNF